MKDEIIDLVLKKFAGLKQQMYSFLDVFNNFLRCLMNRIEIENHRTETYETNKICLSCFDNKIMDMMDQLLVIKVNYKKQLF